MTESPWIRPAGSLARDGWDVVVDSALAGWQHAGLRIANLATGARQLRAAEVERMVIPLTGDVRVAWAASGDHGVIELAGRASVFDGPADTASFGAGTELELTGTGRVAVAETRSDQAREPAMLRAADTAVELRGAGIASRQVHNFGVPGGLPAERLIVCEVITPAGNWSSYPPHKHDETTPGESRLEEVYYFESEVERGRTAEVADPFGMFATYSSAAGDIELAGMVRTGDVVLVPFGYHGPAAAAPGYDLYYLNVMAGPEAERRWKISDDPRHAWIRAGWTDEHPDPRLPYEKKDD